MTAPERHYVVTVATHYVVAAVSPEAAEDDYAAGKVIGSDVVAVDVYGWDLDGGSDDALVDGQLLG